jgi:hypothetical protein
MVWILSLSSCVSFDYLTQVTEDSFPQASQCGKCHVEIYHEWATSDHAAAYVNPHFKQATHDHQFEACLSCHAPQPFRSDPLVTRNMDRSEGITCVSCHLVEGKLAGPLEPTGKIAPHPIDVNPDYYHTSGICGTCHQGELAEWENANRVDKKTCQECHMPEVTRKVTQPTGGISNLIVAFEDTVKQKKHDFSMVSSNMDFDIISVQAIRVNANEITLIIKNNLPHSLPAGDFGFRVMALEALTASTDDNEILLDRMELTKELKNAISPSGTFEWKLGVPPATDFLRIKLSRLSYDEEDVIYLTDIRVPVS